MSLIDAPSFLVGAIRSGLTFLGWRENLTEKEMPPKRIWFDEKRLDRWFKDVKRQQELEVKGKGGDIEGWDGNFVSNEAAKLLIVED